MTATVLAISLAYVVLGVLALTVGLTAKFAWWVKAAAIVVMSVLFIEMFFATKSLLGWPGGGPLPARFQLLWVRVVEPDPKAADPGAIYLWIEETDENNVPSGRPRAYRLPYTRPLADRSAGARDEIMKGKPQMGLAEGIEAEDAREEAKADQARPGNRNQPSTNVIDLEQFQLLQQAQRVEFAPLPTPTLPPKGP
jgi:hypothetical protein